jgi:hypothetical protein
VPRRTFLPFDWANGSRDLNADGDRPKCSFQLPRVHGRKTFDLVIQVETLQEKIISLELTKPDDLLPESPVNGSVAPKDFDRADEKSTSEPPTPTTGDEKTFDEDLGSAHNKKKKRKRSKRGKH